MKFTALFVLVFVSTASDACNEANGGAVDFAGIVNKGTFPGPPNYESIENGDRAETYWIRTTKEKVYVNDFDERQRRFQLFWLGEKEPIKAGEIKVKGKTMEGHSGHHRTVVLIEVGNAIQP